MRIDNQMLAKMHFRKIAEEFQVLCKREMIGDHREITAFLSDMNSEISLEWTISWHKEWECFQLIKRSSSDAKRIFYLWNFRIIKMVEDGLYSVDMRIDENSTNVEINDISVFLKIKNETR